jgi:DNA-directed RNA polymerase specialized sigma24 family protein
VRDPELAEDVLQETWIAALERPPSEGSLRAWLGVVVRNVVAAPEATRGGAR